MIQSTRWFLVLTFALPGSLSFGQTGRSSAMLDALKKPESTWNAAAYYGTLSDFADNRDPRGYVHSLGVGLDYRINKQFILSSSLGLRVETYGGQIEKDPEKPYSETLGLNPSVGLNLKYSRAFGGSHSFGFSFNGQPLFDDESRLEGYRAVFGPAARVDFGFFDKSWTLSHSVYTNTLFNSYRYSSEGSANPDYFYGYNVSTSVRLWRSLKLGYRWGIKYTRYLDDYLSYSFSNSYALSYNWDKVVASLSYENGGFTEDGDVALWFIDEYRRIIKFALAFDF